MVTAQAIESSFIFNSTDIDISTISDDEGQTLGFTRNESGSHFVFTKDLEGIDVAIEHKPDGTKIFHMEKDSKGLPAMHEFKPDGDELIYLFNENKSLEKMVELKNNGDKVTTWFSVKGDTISQEQRQIGGTLYKMNSSFEREALVWLHPDGLLDEHGDELLVNHLKMVFAHALDGL